MSGGVPQHEHSADAEVVEQGAFVDINVTPLVDIFLVLLVILMATSTAILEAGQGEGSGFKVQLPSGAKTEEVHPGGGELVIAVPADGTIIVGGELVTLEELAAMLADQAQKSPDRLVLVQADENAIHKHVVEVMEAARKAGLKNLAIATRPEQ